MFLRYLKTIAQLNSNCIVRLWNFFLLSITKNNNKLIRGPLLQIKPLQWQHPQGMPHKGLKLPKRFTNLPFDFSGYPGEKGRACVRGKKILRIQLEFCIFYMFSLFHPGTYNLSRCQKIQATLCSNFGEVCEPFW